MSAKAQESGGALNLIENFKAENKPEQSIVTFAGTGVNTAKHVEHFSALGIDYLSRLHQLNIVSGSILSYFFYVGMTYGFENTNRVLGYDSYYRKSHGASFTNALAHLVKVKSTNKTAIYDNAQMAESLVYWFGSEFTETKVSVLNPNIRFISYCLESESEIYISSRSYPDMSFGDLVRACVSVPAIYGEFRYNGHRCIDPVFSGKFKQIRKRLLQGPEQHLYLNHKLTHRSSNRHYVSTEDKRFVN